MKNEIFDLESEYVKSVIIGLFLTITIAMTVTLAAWGVYAYKNPTSPSGIWLIEVSHYILFILFLFKKVFYFKFVSYFLASADEIGAHVYELFGQKYARKYTFPKSRGLDSCERTNF